MIIGIRILILENNEIMIWRQDINTIPSTVQPMYETIHMTLKRLYDTKRYQTTPYDTNTIHSYVEMKRLYGPKDKSTNTVWLPHTNHDLDKEEQHTNN